MMDLVQLPPKTSSWSANTQDLIWELITLYIVSLSKVNGSWPEAYFINAERVQRVWSLYEGHKPSSLPWPYHILEFLLHLVSIHLSCVRQCSSELHSMSRWSEILMYLTGRSSCCSTPFQQPRGSSLTFPEAGLRCSIHPEAFPKMEDPLSTKVNSLIP